jgi:hypothetical protein
MDDVDGRFAIRGFAARPHRPQRLGQRFALPTSPQPQRRRVRSWSPDSGRARGRGRHVEVFGPWKVRATPPPPPSANGRAPPPASSADRRRHHRPRLRIVGATTAPVSGPQPTASRAQRARRKRAPARTTTWGPLAGVRRPGRPQPLQGGPGAVRRSSFRGVAGPVFGSSAPLQPSSADRRRHHRPRLRIVGATATLVCGPSAPSPPSSADRRRHHRPRLRSVGAITALGWDSSAPPPPWSADRRPHHRARLRSVAATDRASPTTAPPTEQAHRRANHRRPQVPTRPARSPLGSPPPLPSPDRHRQPGEGARGGAPGRGSRSEEASGRAPDPSDRSQAVTRHVRRRSRGPAPPSTWPAAGAAPQRRLQRGPPPEPRPDAAFNVARRQSRAPAPPSTWPANGHAARQRPCGPLPMQPANAHAARRPCGPPTATRPGPLVSPDHRR